MKRALMVLALLALPAFGLESEMAYDATTCEAVDARRIVPGAKGLLPASWLARPLKGSLAGLSVVIVSTVDSGVTTNVSGIVYSRKDVWYAITGGTLERPERHFPYVKVAYLMDGGNTEFKVAYQDPAELNLNWSSLGTTYEVAWRSGVWVAQGVGTAFFRANVPEEEDRAYADGWPLIGNFGGDWERTISHVFSSGGARLQYVTVDEEGNVSPSNVLATAAQVAAAEAKVAAAEAAAIAQSNAFEQARAEVGALAEAVANAQVTVYQDDFMYSFGVPSAGPSEDAVCRIYRLDSKAGTATRNGVACDRHDVWFGFTEDLGAADPKPMTAASLSDDPLVWTEADHDAAVAQAGTVEVAGDQLTSCWKMPVYIPSAFGASFVKVYVEASGHGGTGDAIDLVGGFAGGLTAEVPVYGGGTLEFQGGLALAPEAEP